jgi:hypothetical protein
MAKQRRGRPTKGRNPTARGARKSKPKSGTHTAMKSALSRSRRPAVVSVDDLDVFLPGDPCSGVAGNTETLTNDEPVFLAAPGPSVAVQSDWIDDAGATVRHEPSSVYEPFQGIRPRAGSPVHWSRAELYAHGLEVRTNRDGFQRVVCRYGCSGTTTNVYGVSHHTYNCPYWTREGSTKVPF